MNGYEVPDGGLPVVFTDVNSGAVVEECIDVKQARVSNTKLLIKLTWQKRDDSQMQLPRMRMVLSDPKSGSPVADAIVRVGEVVSFSEGEK